MIQNFGRNTLSAFKFQFLSSPLKTHLLLYEPVFFKQTHTIFDRKVNYFLHITFMGIF